MFDGAIVRRPNGQGIVSQLSQALEIEVAALHTVRKRANGCAMTPRERALIDRHMSRLLRLLAPRIRHFTRGYGLLDAVDDAYQACAIGVMRAVEMYDPAKASFTTLVNWQLRGELQGLRHRLRPDRRESARAVGARTVSLEALQAERGFVESSMEDAQALERAEALAAEVLARRACGRLLDEHLGEARLQALYHAERRNAARDGDCIKPGTINPTVIGKIDARLTHEREIALLHLLGGDDRDGNDDGLTSEQRRQIARRTIRALGQRARGNPRFDPDAEPDTAPTRH